MKLSIQVRLVVTVIVGMLIWGWLHYYIQQREIMPSFREQEKRLIVGHARHVRELLKYEFEELARFCHDWAAWDDTYSFIRNHNSAYIESNLVYESFENNNLSLIHYMDSSGRKVWHGFYDLSTAEPYADDTFWVRAQWDMEKEPFLQIEGVEDSATGLLALKQGVMLVAARPVLPSSADGEIRGRLIMGRMLHGEVMQRIRNHMRDHVDFIPWKQAEGQFSRDAMATLRGDEVLVSTDPQDRTLLQGNIALFDLWNKPVMVARVHMRRTLVLHGEKALMRNVQGNLIAGSAVLVLMLVILQRIVVLPIRHLTSSVQSIGQQPEWEDLPRKLTQAEDEIGVLAREFDRMLGRIRTQIEFKDEIAAKLERSKARTRLVLDTTPDAIFAVAADGSIKTNNRGAEFMLGYDEGEFNGKRIQDLLAPMFKERLQHRLDAGMSSCSCFSAGCEVQVMRRDGKEISVHMRGCPMEDKPEPMILWTMRDISELKRMHEQVSHHERLAAIGQMGASVAHDIRNPLTGISGGLQMLLKQGDLNAMQRQVLVEILSLADRIEHTVTQMLAYSKRWEPATQKLNLLAFLQRIGDEFAARPEFAHISFAFSGERRLYIMADPELMRQVFNNLYHNAQESMGDKGRIGSIVTRDGSMAKILIKDSGSGMDQDVVEHVLEPFYSTKSNGTGLGLAICKKIIEAHDGNIRFESKKLQGTTVIVELPLGNTDLTR